MSDGKTVSAIFAKFSGCVDPPGGRVLLGFPEVNSTPGTFCMAPSRKVFRAPTRHALQPISVKLYGWMGAKEGCVLFV